MSIPGKNLAAQFLDGALCCTAGGASVFKIVVSKQRQMSPGSECNYTSWIKNKHLDETIYRTCSTLAVAGSDLADLNCSIRRRWPSTCVWLLGFLAADRCREAH